MGAKQPRLSESMEDYLETILGLEKQYKVARVKDIAGKMGILGGSVTNALKQLADKDLIHYKPYSYITLTKKGEMIAKEVEQIRSDMTESTDKKDLGRILNAIEDKVKFEVRNELKKRKMYAPHPSNE